MLGPLDSYNHANMEGTSFLAFHSPYHSSMPPNHILLEHDITDNPSSSSPNSYGTSVVEEFRSELDGQFRRVDLK